jgi:hypothetical protein
MRATNYHECGIERRQITYGCMPGGREWAMARVREDSWEISGWEIRVGSLLA